MRFLNKKIIFILFSLGIFLTAQSAFAISQLSCSQAQESVNCLLKTDTISKPLLDQWLGVENNSIKVNLLAENKVVASVISYKADDYSFNIPISYLKSQNIDTLKDVTFAAKIYKSGPGSDPNMVYLDSNESKVSVLDLTKSSVKTTGTTTSKSSATETGTTGNLTNKSATTGTGATINSNSQKDYFNKFLNISKDTGSVNGPTTINAIADIFLIIMQWIFAFALILGIIMVIISGISYMTAAGDSDKVGKATKILTYSVIGVAIALISSFVIQIIRGLLS